MTSERKKAILIVSAVVIVGFVSGFLVHGFINRYQHSHQQERGGHSRRPGDKKDWFVGTIYRIVQPDSAQSDQIKPITKWAASQIDSVEQYSNQRLADILDSVKVQLKPIITEEQLKRLDEFDAKAKGQWRGGHGRR